MKCHFCTHRIIGRSKKYSWSKFGVHACYGCRRATSLIMLKNHRGNVFTIELLKSDFIQGKDVEDEMLGNYRPWEIGRKMPSLACALQSIVDGIVATPVKLTP